MGPWNSSSCLYPTIFGWSIESSDLNPGTELLHDHSAAVSTRDQLRLPAHRTIPRQAFQTAFLENQFHGVPAQRRCESQAESPEICRGSYRDRKDRYYRDLSKALASSQNPPVNIEIVWGAGVEWHHFLQWEEWMSPTCSEGWRWATVTFFHWDVVVTESAPEGFQWVKRGMISSSVYEFHWHNEKNHENLPIHNTTHTHH